MSNNAVQEADHWKETTQRAGRSSEVRGGSSRKLEEVAKMEGGTPAKQRRKMTKPTAVTKPASGGRGKGGRGKKK